MHPRLDLLSAKATPTPIIILAVFWKGDAGQGFLLVEAGQASARWVGVGVGVWVGHCHESAPKTCEHLRGQGRGSRAEEASTASPFSVGRLLFV